MAPESQPPGVDREARTAAVRGERSELLEHLQDILEPTMAALGLVFLGLLLVDYASVDLGGGGRAWLDRALQVIWALFLIDFVIRFAVAPGKWVFLRRNWLAALSLALPFLRPLRVLRAARALRSLSLVRFLGGINRGMRVLRQVTRGRQFAYVGVLTVLVVVASAVGVLFFDREVEDAPIRSFGDAIWWSAAMVTTINNEKYVVSPEARTIAVLERVYAVSVFGFITASIASYLVGNQPGTGRDADDRAALLAEVAALRRDLAAARRDRILAGIEGPRTIGPVDGAAEGRG